MSTVVAAVSQRARFSGVDMKLNSSGCVPAALQSAHPVLTERRRNVDKAALKMLRKA